MRKLKIIAAGAVLGLMLAWAYPAQACACSDYTTVQDFAASFNAQPYEIRSGAHMIAPAGFAFSDEYYLVGMNLCGQSEGYTCIGYAL